MHKSSIENESSLLLTEHEENSPKDLKRMATNLEDVQIFE